MMKMEFGYNPTNPNYWPSLTFKGVVADKQSSFLRLWERIAESSSETQITHKLWALIQRSWVVFLSSSSCGLELSSRPNNAEATRGACLLDESSIFFPVLSRGKLTSAREYHKSGGVLPESAAKTSFTHNLGEPSITGMCLEYFWKANKSFPMNSGL